MNSPQNTPRITEPLPPEIAFEVLPRNLSAYREGNTGIPYSFFFDSGVPGPRVAINCLTHGNEFCGMVAVCALLEAGVRPERGSLSLSFANVAAYESFDIAAPFDSRQLVHNLNRIWSDAELAGGEKSPELDRAREMQPLFDKAHALLDIHSTTQPVPPFFVYSAGASSRTSRALADGIGFPAVQLVMPGGMQTGTPLIEYGPFSPARAAHAHSVEAFAPGAGGSVVVECGQHFSKRAGIVATLVSLSFLRHTGVLSAECAAELSVRLTGEDLPPTTMEKPQRYELVSTHVIRTPNLRWTRPLQGMEVFAKDEIIGYDGEFEVRSPCDGCTIFMPLAAYRAAVPGREGAYFTQVIEAAPREALAA
jgi:predicted deacylase